MRFQNFVPYQNNRPQKLKGILIFQEILVRIPAKYKYRRNSLFLTKKFPIESINNQRVLTDLNNKLLSLIK